MPPKVDPYATAAHRRIDVALLLLTLAIAAFVFGGSITKHSNPSNPHRDVIATQRAK